jgi:bacterioferritin (cytochrome b1)
MEMMTANLKVDKQKWQTFKKIAKVQNSDASKEIRKFMERYISENKEVINKLF